MRNAVGNRPGVSIVRWSLADDSRLRGSAHDPERPGEVVTERGCPWADSVHPGNPRIERRNNRYRESLAIGSVRRQNRFCNTSELTVVEKIAEWQRRKVLELDSVSSPITGRVYNMALEEFLTWFRPEPGPGFTKATVRAWRVSLEARGLGSSSIIIRMSAIRKLAVEAADNGLLAPELAAGITRTKIFVHPGIVSTIE
jgi:hypothetical protein